jgi:hypothetical protein
MAALIARRPGTAPDIWRVDAIGAKEVRERTTPVLITTTSFKHGRRASFEADSERIHVNSCSK